MCSGVTSSCPEKGQELAEGRMPEPKHDFYEAKRSKNTGFCIGRFGVEAILHRRNGVPSTPGKAQLGQRLISVDNSKEGRPWG